MSLREHILSSIRTIDDPVRKRAVFTGLLSLEVEKRSGRRPIVVGGSAVEIYTQGVYKSGDIDLKAPRQILLSILSELEFRPMGRVYYENEMDICIDFVGEALDEGTDAERRTPDIEIPYGGSRIRVRVISLEDLIVDRLSAAKNWKDSDSRKWAAVLIYIGRSSSIKIDDDYLASRLAREGLAECYREVCAEFSESAIKSMLEPYVQGHRDAIA